MVGTVEISEDVVWMPSRALVEKVLPDLATQVGSADKDLAATLLEAQPPQYASLTRLDAGRLRAVLEAAEALWEREMSKHLHRSAQALPRAGLRNESLLKALLRTDPRAERDPGATGVVTLQKGAAWTAPVWAYDLVLEHLAADAQSTGVEMARQLLAARAYNGSGSCDLSLLAPERLRSLLPGAQYLATVYGDGEGKGAPALAPAFFAELGPHVRAFKALLDSDPRAAPGG